MGGNHKYGPGVAICVISLAVASLIVPGNVDAVDTDMSISTTAIDFGQVNVGVHRPGVGDADEHRRRPVRTDQHFRRRATDRGVQRVAELPGHHAPGRRIVHGQLLVLARLDRFVQRHVELHDQRDQQPGPTARTSASAWRASASTPTPRRRRRARPRRRPPRPRRPQRRWRRRPTPNQRAATSPPETQRPGGDPDDRRLTSTTRTTIVARAPHGCGVGATAGARRQGRQRRR